MMSAVSSVWTYLLVTEPLASTVRRAGWLRSNLRLRLVSALDGTSIRFDIVVRIVRPEIDGPSGAPPPRLSGGRKTGRWNFIRRGGFWYSGAVCFICADWRQEYSAESSATVEG